MILLDMPYHEPLLIALVHTGMALPPVVLGLLLYILLSRAGPLAFLGWLFTVEAMTLAQFLLALPFVVGITANVVASVPRDLTLQLRSLGRATGSAAGPCCGRPAPASCWRSRPRSAGASPRPGPCCWSAATSRARPAC